MTMGHYATALIPWARRRSWPLWLLLVCAQWGDLMWLLLAALGVEPTQPENFLDMSVANMQVSMLWSHGLVSALVQAAVVTAVVWGVWKDRALGLACGALMVGHMLCDGLVGWKHEVAGEGSPMFGLGLFGNASTIAPAILLEAVFAAGCVWWFIRTRQAAGEPVSPRARLVLYAVFSGGALMFIGNAQTSMREMLARFSQ